MLIKSYNTALITFLTIACLTAPSQASTFENAEIVTTEFRADLVYFETRELSAEKWFIGPCVDYTSKQTRRVRLHETQDRFRADVEVRLVDNKFNADKVLCLN